VQWVSWTREWISSVSYSVLVNGTPCGLIKPSRGVRQGNPLSPYIFIICFELLNISLLRAANQPKSGIGIKISPRDQKIPCLMFADDCLIFSKANYSTCCKLKVILDDFCEVSRQMITFHKYSLTFSSNSTHSSEGDTWVAQPSEGDLMHRFFRISWLARCLNWRVGKLIVYLRQGGLFLSSLILNLFQLILCNVSPFLGRRPLASTKSLMNSFGTKPTINVVFWLFLGIRSVCRRNSVGLVYGKLKPSTKRSNVN